MQFIMIVGYLDGSSKPWTEDEDRPSIKTKEQARQWAEDCIKSFNDTLRSTEAARKLIGVKFPETQSASEAHVWQKTNLVTQMVRSQVFDTLLCLECGVTAKRHGLDNIVLDSSYRAKGFRSCRTAQELLKKRREKKNG
jgi:hypothetical protein